MSQISFGEAELQARLSSKRFYLLLTQVMPNWGKLKSSWMEWHIGY